MLQKFCVLKDDLCCRNSASLKMTYVAEILRHLKMSYVAEILRHLKMSYVEEILRP